MQTVPRRRRQQSGRQVPRRRSRRTRRSLLLVFALVFAPVAARTARAACIEFATLPEGVVSNINQNIVRVGFTLDLPVYGRYPNTARP